MNTYEVKYIIQTSSRYGKYNYDCTDTIMADTLQEAKEKTKEVALTKTSFKRIRIIFKSIANVSEF